MANSVIALAILAHIFAGIKADRDLNVNPEDPAVATVVQIVTLKNLRSIAGSSPLGPSRQHPDPKSDPECITKCLNDEIPAEVAYFFRSVAEDVFMRENSTNIARLFNQTMLGRYCGFVNDRFTCISKCADDPMKVNILKYMKTTLFMCNETKFVEYAGCYREVYANDTNLCESEDRCGKFRYSHLRETENVVPAGAAADATTEQEHTYNATLEISRKSDGLCSYINCGLDCRRQELVGKCGNEKTAVLITFYRKLIEYLETLAAALGEDATEHPKFSEKCRQIGFSSA